MSGNKVFFSPSEEKLPIYQINNQQRYQPNSKIDKKLTMDDLQPQNQQQYNNNSNQNQQLNNNIYDNTATFISQSSENDKNNVYNFQAHQSQSKKLQDFTSLDSDFDMSQSKLQKLGLQKGINKEVQEYSDLLKNYNKQFNSQQVSFQTSNTNNLSNNQGNYTNNTSLQQKYGHILDSTSANTTQNQNNQYVISDKLKVYQDKMLEIEKSMNQTDLKLHEISVQNEQDKEKSNSKSNFGHFQQQQNNNNNYKQSLHTIHMHTTTPHQSDNQDSSSYSISMHRLQPFGSSSKNQTSYGQTTTGLNAPIRNLSKQFGNENDLQKNLKKNSKPIDFGQLIYEDNTIVQQNLLVRGDILQFLLEDVCSPNCQTCSQISENCDTCIGANRLKPTCECNVGYYYDGINNDCQPCKYTCSQCSYYPNEFNILFQIGSYKYSTLTEIPNQVDPFGNISTIQQSNKLIRFGTESPNNIPLLFQGQKYQFCLWIKFISGFNIGDQFEFDIQDRVNNYFITDKDGTIIYNLGQHNIGPYLSYDWTRVCVNAELNNLSNYKFIDIGTNNDNKIFAMYGQYLSQVSNVASEPVPYIIGSYNDGTCKYCSHYSRTGSQCACSPGYYEVSQGSIECHSPKPSDCEKYIRIESSGLMISNPDSNSDYAKFYMNDIQLGSNTSIGYNLLVLDENFELIDQKVYNVLGNANSVYDMKSYIESINEDTVVLVAINDEASINMNDDGYLALQMLGLNQYTRFNYRDAFAMIGKKGASPGTVKQVVGRNVNYGRANLVGCLRCSSKCYSCLDEFNQFPVIQDIYSFGIPSLNPNLLDFQGQKGEVYESVGIIGDIDQKSLVRFGRYRDIDKPVDQIFKGKIYQFSIWIKLKSGQTQKQFNFDIVDKSPVRYLSNEDGQILQVLNNDHDLQNILDENWKKLVINALHDNESKYQFIDIGQSNDQIDFEFSYPQLFEIPHLYYPPVRHVSEGQPQEGCYKCLHYTRIPPACECTEGYQEINTGDTICQAPIPNDCSKYIRIESAGINYAEYDIGDYLRIYMNNVSIGTFTRGISLVILNDVTFEKEQQQTFDSGDVLFDPITLINFIDNITNNKIVLVGIKGDGSQNFTSQLQLALQNLGMDSNTIINYQDGFAMIGQKDSNPGTAKQKQGFQIQGGKANIVSCLKGCEHQCQTCSNEPDQCNTCSHSTRNSLNNCKCKDTYYNKNYNIICEPCESPCVNCLSQTQCSSCITGYFLNNTDCIKCDNTKCATCQNSADECLLSCNSGCQTCKIDQTCDTCEDGQFLESGQCKQCNNTVCATCSGSAINCDLQCDSSCKTCNINQECLTCEIGEYLENINKTCQQCDKSKCGTCENNADECIQQCHVSCKTCNIDGNCINCQDGYYLNGLICSQCDNTKCGTCNSNQLNCDIPCDSTCKTCNILGECISCEISQYIDQNQSNKCIDCNYRCSQCQNNSLECKNCSDQSRNFNNNCLCKIGFYDQKNNSSVCLKCDLKCKECEDSQDNCISCIDESRSSPPNCNCSEKYYQNQDGDCKPCLGDCQCNNQGQCLVCLGKTPQLRQLPSCNCNFGYFENQSNQCQICDIQCKSCVGQSNNCQICQQSINRSIQPPNCLCNDGYYSEPGKLECKQCYQGCVTCSSYQVCTGNQCKVAEFQMPDCIKSSIYAGFQVVINPGQNNQQVIYKNCQIQCASCQNYEFQCTSCMQGKNRQQQVPNCECQFGYHDNEKQSIDCYKCPSNCLTCVSPYKCSSCNEDDNMELDPVSLKCKCSNGFTYQNQFNKCIPCYSYRGQCFKQCPENTIKDDRNKSCNDVVYEKKSIKNIIYICFIILVIFQVIWVLIIGCFSKLRIQVLKRENEDLKQNNVNNIKYSVGSVYFQQLQSSNSKKSSWQSSGEEQNA